MMRIGTGVLGAACAAAMGFGGVAQAQSLSGASDEPIDLEADRCEGSTSGATEYVCEGNVRIAQGPALLTGDRVLLRFFEGTQDPRLIEGTGRVRYANGEDAIGGNRGVFDAQTGTVTVTGDVVVVQGEQVLTGERLVYNTQTGAISFSAAEGGRVRGLFRPGAATQADAETDGETSNAAPTQGLRR